VFWLDGNDGGVATRAVAVDGGFGEHRVGQIVLPLPAAAGRVPDGTAIFCRHFKLPTVTMSTPKLSTTKM
jgi:hypothetical protein